MDCYGLYNVYEIWGFLLSVPSALSLLGALLSAPCERPVCLRCFHAFPTSEEVTVFLS